MLLSCQSFAHACRRLVLTQSRHWNLKRKIWTAQQEWQPREVRFLWWEAYFPCCQSWERTVTYRDELPREDNWGDNKISVYWDPENGRVITKYQYLMRDRLLFHDSTGMWAKRRWSGANLSGNLAWRDVWCLFCIEGTTPDVMVQNGDIGLIPAVSRNTEGLLV